MDAFDQIFLREWLPPDPRDQLIYHYTSAAGFLGIVTSGVLRGSNAAFLNDAREIAYGADICRGVLQEEKERRTRDFDRMTIEIALQDFAPAPEPTDVYVTSFSEEADHLGQWRAYGALATGYCLGFRVGRFSERDILRSPVPVIYEPRIQKERVRRAVAFACELEVEAADERHAAMRRGSRLSMCLRRLLCLLKHPRFADEHEWRAVVTGDRTNEVGGVDFIERDGALRPFVVMLRGSRETLRLPIEHVLVADQRRRALNATRLLLDQHGYGDVRVSATEIPFA